MKFKNWLIKKLGGYTQEQHNNALKHHILNELELRVRNGNEVVIGVRSETMFEYILHMFNPDSISMISKAHSTFKVNDTNFRVINITNKSAILRTRGINLNGYFFID